MVALEIRNLSVVLQGRTVLEDVNLSLEEGSFMGLIGPNGAGKTIFLKTVTGIVAPTSGSVRIFGKDIREARGLVGYVPQFGAFDSTFPICVRDVVLMGRLAHRGLMQPYTKGDRKLTDELLEKVDLASLADREVGKLSGGQLQRVLIARALAVQPKLLLLDEPTSSLDMPRGQSFYELLQSISSGMTIILVSHDVGVISESVKTVACLNKKLHYHNSKELSNDVLQEVYGCPIELLAHGHAHRVLDKH